MVENGNVAEVIAHAEEIANAEEENVIVHELENGNAWEVIEIAVEAVGNENALEEIVHAFLEVTGCVAEVTEILKG